MNKLKRRILNAQLGVLYDIDQVVDLLDKPVTINEHNKLIQISYQSISRIDQLALLLLKQSTQYFYGKTWPIPTLLVEYLHKEQFDQLLSDLKYPNSFSTMANSNLTYRLVMIERIMKLTKRYFISDNEMVLVCFLAVSILLPPIKQLCYINQSHFAHTVTVFNNTLIIKGKLPYVDVLEMATRAIDCLFSEINEQTSIDIAERITCGLNLLTLSILGFFQTQKIGTQTNGTIIKTMKLNLTDSNSFSDFHNQSYLIDSNSQASNRQETNLNLSKGEV